MSGDQVEGRVEDLVVGLVATLAACSVAGLDRAALCDVVAGAGRVRSAADALEARALAAIERLDDKGAPASTVARSAGGCSQREADRRARRAETLARMPHAADALAAGGLSVEHVDALVRAVEATSVESVAASGLVEQARGRPADVHARTAREWTRRQQCDADVAAVQRRRHEARRLVIFEGDDGMVVLHGEFDPVTGARVRSVLDAETDRLFRADGGRDGADEARTPQQRRADALLAALTGGAGPGGAGRGSGGGGPVRTQLIVLATLDEGEISEGRLVDGAPLPDAVLTRMACGSDLFALMLSQAGDPLWMGRRTRLASDAQWRALIARDGGCRVCGVDPSRCEAHHLVPWRPPGRGPTDIDNLALLCTHHHHLVHDNGHQLVQTPGGTWTLQPP